MRTNRIVVAALLLLLFEGAVVPWLIPEDWSTRLYPHFAFILALFVAGVAGRHAAFLFGLGFGLLQDLLAYGHLIGPYAFGMGLLGYAAGLFYERKPMKLGFLLWIVMIATLLLDTIVYSLYMLFGLTDLSYPYALYWQIAPTALLQTLLALLLYVPLRRYAVKPSALAPDEAKE